MIASPEFTQAIDLVSSPVQVQEAFESFPRELKVVSLYLSIISSRVSFNKLVDDLYLFMKDRYFIGEVLEACVEGKSWSNCTILQVREPTEQEIKYYHESEAGSMSQDPIFPPACLYHYKVEKFCSYNDINRVFEASASHVRRKKRLITKGKLKLLLKQCLVQNSLGNWSVQESIQHHLGIDGMKFSDIFVGQPPKFPNHYNVKKVKKELSNQAGNVRNNIDVKKEGVKKSEQSKKSYLDCFVLLNAVDVKTLHVTNSHPSVSGRSLSPVKASKFVPKDSTKVVKNVKKKYAKSEEKKNLNNSVKRKWRGLSWEERQKMKENKQNKIQMEKLKIREEKLKAKAKREEEKYRTSMFFKNRLTLREDLECEDLKPMPIPEDIKCSYLPNELFGDFMVILEFLQSFQSIVQMKSYFPRGLAFNQLERDLFDNNLDGPLCNIIMLLLTALYKMREDENEVTVTDGIERNESPGEFIVGESVRFVATKFSNRLYQDMFLSEVLNHLTVSEFLRLHLVLSNGRNNDINLLNQHDVSSFSGDPVTILLKNYPHLLRHLSSFHVCEISVKEKISVLNCLIDQVLACLPVQEEIDKRGEQLKQIKLEMRAFRSAQIKRDKEAQTRRIKEKQETKVILKGGESSQSNCLGNDVHRRSASEMQFEKELRSKKSEIEGKMSEMRILSMGFNLRPIGMDRAHRRYWVFSSLPGLFLENNPFEIGPCLSQATPRQISSPKDIKESKNPNRKSVQYKTPMKKDVKEAAAKSGSCDQVPERTEMWVCTSSPSCPVHNHSTPCCRWSYFANEDDVTRLIKCFNENGIREGELKKLFIRDQQLLKEIILQCPKQILNCVDLKQKSYASCKYRHLKCPRGKSADWLQELILREEILNLQTRISSRCMGTLFVKDVETWREAIRRGEYDMQFDKLAWGFNSILTENDVLTQPSSENNEVVRSETVDVESSITQDLDSGTSSLSKKSPTKLRESISGHLLEEKTGDNQLFEQHTSGELSVDLQDAMMNDVKIITNASDDHSKAQCIKNLACAILQLSQAVDLPFLRKPLCDGDDETEKSLQLQHWEVSLMTSSSFSQLFLHIYLLDASINWSKSVLNKRCVVCRKQRDGEKMLLCDSCDKGHHMYCLKPKLEIVPKGDWYCSKCEPKDIKNNLKRKNISSNSEGGSKEYEKRPSKSRKIVHDDVCNVCGLRYNLILCSACPLVYHRECLIPPLKSVPEGVWVCNSCNAGGVDAIEEKENASTSRRSLRRASVGCSLSSSLLQDLLTNLMDHRDAWPFLQPVRKSLAPRYYVVIKKPMDLGTMKYKLNRAQYKNNREFVVDALLIFENCRMFNDNKSAVYKCGSRLLQYFKRRCKDLGLGLLD